MEPKFEIALTSVRKDLEPKTVKKLQDIWWDFGQTVMEFTDPEEVPTVLNALSDALHRVDKATESVPFEKFVWKTVTQTRREDIEEGFNIRRQSLKSKTHEPWPPVHLNPFELPAVALDTVKIIRKFVGRSANNESAIRCVVNVILFAMLDQVTKLEPNGTWPLNLQTEIYLQSNIMIVEGERMRIRGKCDYTLWYGDKRGPVKEINLVLVETKRERYAGIGGDDQVLAYMGCVHQERKRTPGRSATVYGITTDSEEWRFLRINDQGEWALAVYPYEEEDNYEKVATMLAFIMHQAVISSPYASKTHSKEVSTEDA